MISIEELKNKISESQIKGHFEVGKQFHSETYINLKFFFSDSKVLELLSNTLLQRLKDDINPENKPTTFIGFRSYTGNLLSLLCKNSSINNYYIVESEDEKLMWQSNPDEAKIKENIIVILPVSCTSSYIFKIKDFLNSNFPNKKFKKFVNIFMIFDEGYKAPIDYDSLKVSLLYKPFNWSKIDKNKTICIHQNDTDTDGLIGFTLVDVYTKLNLKHECKLCFPDSSEDEELLHPYHTSYESTKLLAGYPRYVYKSNLEISESERAGIIFNESNAENFKRLFFGTEKIHFYGNIKSRSGTYNHFINGNGFYLKNKPEILNKFSEKLFSISKDYSKIVFVTAEGTNNSGFLEDLLALIQDKIKDVSILRFTSDHEFIDSFINNHREVLIDKSNDGNRLLIYFEEIMSGTGTFKLLSNYIKHYRDIDDSVDENDFKKHAFDYIFTLIDRTSANIESEVLKKLYSKRNIEPEKHFIKFYELNTPVFNTPHMGNPIENEELIINKIKNTSNLDALKKYIIDTELTPKKIYLPEDFYKPENNTKYEQLGIPKSEYNLIKLYCTDKIYEKLSTLDEMSEFDLTSVFTELNKDNQEVDFITNVYDSEKLLKDIVLKILTKHPFIHYKNICESALKYCIHEIKESIKELEKTNNEDVKLYYAFWSLRFYIKRLIELNSKFIISKDFFEFLFRFYSEKGSYSKLFLITEENDMLNKEYHKNQIQSFSAFLLYCYKRLIYDDFGTSIKLENLLNENNFLSKSGINEITDETIVPIFQNSYFKFMDMLTLENIYPFQKIIESKELVHDNDHFKNFIFHNYDDFSADNQSTEIEYKYYENEETSDELKKMALYELTHKFLTMIKNEVPANSSISLLYEYQSENEEDHYYYYNLVDSDDNIGSNIKLKENSFAKHFIKGIAKNNKVQSFYTIIKVNDAYHTFTNHYEYDTNPDWRFNDSLKNDLNIINENDTVILFLRLSESYLKKADENGTTIIAKNHVKEDIKGNGAIIISFKLNDFNTVFDFIDSRKMRNLLFVRNFFLKKLKSKFEAQNFIEVLEQIKLKEVRSKFNHGIDSLQKDFLNFFNNSQDINDYKKLIYPFEQIYSQIELLISYKNISKNYKFSLDYNLSPEIINDIFDIYMKLIDSGNAQASSKIKLDNTINKSIKVPFLIKLITLPEIFYNIRKIIYGQNLLKGIDQISISVSLSEDERFLIVKNPFKGYEGYSFNKRKGGIEMNNEIMEVLDFDPIVCIPNSDNTLVTTKIQISK